ncbi:MFS transporter [Uliginosibacterium sp. H3]|uniref:MFS transporter n=1 Tax=Uliginosibacterium silvisoli TaxID=3114758 RepID=A0ABU6K1A2_9RHOO|nr:MFS transporter [Uliginosibacterium sp. H3]
MNTVLPPRRAILLIGALQFVYVLDFMMVMPLGPDFAAALGFGASDLGWLAAALTLASIAAGICAMHVLDRFDRKPALLVVLAGLGIATLASAWATGFASLLAARALVGLFAAPTIALGMAIIIDVTPPQARGAAISKVMIGFSLAAIAGVPFALELAARFGWQAPFYVVSALAALVWIAAAWLLPALRGHLNQPARTSPRQLLARPAVQTASLMQAAAQFSAFLVIPGFSAFFMLNLGFPRAQLSLLYLAGGICALIAIQLMGRLVDKRGPRSGVLIASTAFSFGLIPLLGIHALPLALPFVLFMAGNAARNVGLSVANSHVPAPHERAGFMALQNIVTNTAISAAAVVSSLMLGEAEGGRLTGMSGVVILAAVSAACVPWLLKHLQQQLRERAASAAVPPAANQAAFQPQTQRAES